MKSLQIKIVVKTTLVTSLNRVYTSCWKLLLDLYVESENMFELNSSPLVKLAIMSLEYFWWTLVLLPVPQSNLITFKVPQSALESFLLKLTVVLNVCDILTKVKFELECEKVYMYVGTNAGTDGMDGGSHTEQQRDKEES
uniref:Uncharacterized protein n=1 Tax=Glossina pallidipes TaxID=7398 RepID=A0A1A9ZFR4_GLOPL